MTAASGFRLHAAAAQDITDIWTYIAKDNPGAAGTVREEILTALRTLVSFPHSGYERPDLTTRPIRFRRVREYLIAYAPDEKPLVVLGVIHGRRHPHAIAAILRNRSGE